MAWVTLPDLIFSDIMMMVGLESLESLHRCRQVCSQWNEKILRDIWENQSKKKIMKERIEKNWDLEIFPKISYDIRRVSQPPGMIRKKRIVSNWGPGRLPSDEEISHAKWLEARGILATEKIERFIVKVQDVFKDAYHHEEENFAHNIEGQRVLMCTTSLAHYGLLGSVENMILRNLNLRGTPTKHMASLVSCVTHSLYIDKVQNCDLVSILTSLKCQELFITRQSLGREETRALVCAMESCVQVVKLATTSRPTSESSSKELNLGWKLNQTWTRPDLDLT